MLIFSCSSYCPCSYSNGRSSRANNLARLVTSFNMGCLKPWSSPGSSRMRSALSASSLGVVSALLVAGDRSWSGTAEPSTYREESIGILHLKLFWQPLWPWVPVLESAPCNARPNWALRLISWWSPERRTARGLAWLCISNTHLLPPPHPQGTVLVWREL